MKALWFFWPNKNRGGEDIAGKLREIPGVTEAYCLDRKMDIYTGMAVLEGVDKEAISKTIMTRLIKVPGIMGSSTRFVED